MRYKVFVKNIEGCYNGMHYPKGGHYEKIIFMENNQPKVKDSIFEGLAPVVCYEPWFPRCLEAIKQCLNDGYPVLIRLHSAANYPNTIGDCYKQDLESQAVLIVGYDDEKEAVAIIDPWNNNWGGEIGGRRWVTYVDVSKQTVNTSLGMAMCLTPPQVNLTPQFDANHNLSIPRFFWKSFMDILR